MVRNRAKSIDFRREYKLRALLTFVSKVKTLKGAGDLIWKNQQMHFAR
jgi:hypothetical protein